MRQLIISASLCIAAALNCPSASAYECTSVPDSNPALTQAWNQRCLPYFIQRDGTLISGEVRRLLIRQSFDVWSSNNCTDIVFMDLGYTNQQPGFDPDSNSNENVIMSVENRADADQLFGGEELAITLSSFNTATGEIFDSDILFNNASFPFQDITDADGCRSQSPMPYDLRNTLVHEIGHFIGFDHTEDEESTMFSSAPECEIKKRDLSTDDTLGLCTVYGAGRVTATCLPPDDYDIGPGDPSDFRDQCDRHINGGGCGCRASALGRRLPSMLIVAVLVIGLVVRRRRERSTGR